MVVALSLVVVYLTNRPAVDQHLSASSLVRRVRLAIRVMLSSGRATSEVRLTLTLTLPSLNPNSHLFPHLNPNPNPNQLVATDEPVMKMDTDVPVTTKCESDVSVEIELTNYAAQIYLPHESGARGCLFDLKLAIMEAALLVRSVTGAPLSSHTHALLGVYGRQADPESESLPTQWLGGDFDSMVVHCDDLKGDEALLTDANFQRFRTSLSDLRVSQLVAKAAPKKRLAPYVPRTTVAAPQATRPSQAAAAVSALDAALASRSAMLSDDLVMD